MEQVLANICILTARYALSAFGLSVIYRFTGYLDFAQGAIYAIGAYSSFVFVSVLQLPLFLSIILGSAVAGCCGGLIDFAIYRPIRQKAQSNFAVLLASLGLLVSVENLLALVFGEASRSLTSGGPRLGILFLGARVTELQLTLIGSAIGVCFAVWLFLHRTRLGLMFRALGSDRMLATAVGIPPEKLFIKGAILGSLLSGIAGGLIVLETDISPMIGTDALLVGVLVTLLGGPGRMGGAVLAAVIIATLEGLGGMYISVLWRDVIAFSLILAAICLKSEVMFARRRGVTS